MKRGAIAIVVLASGILAPALAHGDRKPTTKEKAQIASVIHLPAVCARVRVSTLSRKPKWGSVSWRRGGSQCEAFASNGVTIVKKSTGRWRLITAGSSFDCKGLYEQVPRAIAQDLRIKCTRGSG